MKNFLQKLIFVFLLIGVTYVYGQRTAYENKVTEIKAKYLRKFGMPAKETEILKKSGDILLNRALNQQQSKYKKIYGDTVVLAMILEMLKELKEAEKLLLILIKRLVLKKQVRNIEEKKKQKGKQSKKSGKRGQNKKNTKRLLKRQKRWRYIGLKSI